MSNEDSGARRPLVVGFDGSQTAVRALTWAARQGRRTATPLIVVVAWQPAHLTSDDDARRGHAQQLAARARRILRQLGEPDAAVTVARGPAAGVLLAHARGASAVVIGSRGHLGPLGRALGSVSREVVTHAVVPVVVLGPESDVTRWTHPVLSATASKVDDATLAWAAHRAQQTGETLHVVDTFQPRFALGPLGGDERHGERAAAERAHAQLLARIRRLYPRVDVTGELHAGRSHEVLATVLLADDVLVVGASDEDARPALRAVPCPVVMVPRNRPLAVTTRQPVTLPRYADQLAADLR